MQLVVAIKDGKLRKNVEGCEKTIIPFVGLDIEPPIPQLGIGFGCLEDKRIFFWGVAPLSLIQSWRGMRILEQLEKIERNSLAACLGVAKNNLPAYRMYQSYLDELARVVGGVDNLKKIRQKILSSAPTAEELQGMIINTREALLKKGWDLDGHELKEEIEVGRVTTSSLIEDIIRSAKEGWPELKKE